MFLTTREIFFVFERAYPNQSVCEEEEVERFVRRKGNLAD